MTLIQGRGCPRRERLSVAPFITLLGSFSPPKSESFKQTNRPLRLKSPAAATSVLKSSEDDLQRIFKAVLEAQTPAFASALAPVVSKKP